MLERKGKIYNDREMSAGKCHENNPVHGVEKIVCVPSEYTDESGLRHLTDVHL